MDKLDRISLWAIAVLVISSFALMNRHSGEAMPDARHPGNTRQEPSAAVAGNAEFEGRVKAVKGLMEGDSLAKAEALATELARRYPFEGEPRMLLGDINFRRQEPVKAVFEYRAAVDLNPDYLDRKTPLFQGKKLKTAVREALEEIEKTLETRPGDESLKKTRRVIYYMQRRIAGSCG